MKKLNLLNRSGMSPDGTSRKGRYCLDPILSRLCLASLICLCMLTVGVGNAWGALPASPTWTATALGSIPDGSTVIIMSSSVHALPSTTTGSNPTKISCTVTTSAGVSTISPASGTLQALAWTLTKVNSNYKFYQEGSNTIRLFLNSTTSNTALRVGNASSSNDQFVMGSGGKLLKVTTAGRYVGPYSGGSDWRTYNSETHDNYNSASLTFYVLNTGGGCSSEVAITKGAETHGTYDLSGATVCADGDGGEISASNIEPDDCYEFASITTSASGTPDNTNKKITGITAATTITVNFQKKTVNTYIDDIQDNGTTEDCGTHDAPTLSDKTPASSGTCAQQHYHFMGWVTAAKIQNNFELMKYISNFL